LREKSSYCCDGCGQKLNWCIDGSFTNPHMHHDHKSGKVYGFVTQQYNLAQGHFKKIGNGNSKLQINWLKFHFPTTVAGRQVSRVDWR
jgi:hypothetical protein